MENQAKIDQLLSDDSIPTDEKLMMWISMFDIEGLVKELELTAMIESMGVQRASLAERFAYRVLRITRPDLFDRKDAA